MEEENELKLLVKNVAKKLTYEDDEHLPQLNDESKQDDHKNSKSGQFYLMISDEDMDEEESENEIHHSPESSDEAFEY